MNTIKLHKNQCKHAKQMPNECRGHIPTTEFPERAGAELLHKCKTMNLNYENAYTPQTLVEPKAQLIKYLIQGDNDPRWFKPEECRYCNKTTGYHRLHRLLECKNSTFTESKSRTALAKSWISIQGSTTHKSVT